MLDATIKQVETSNDPAFGTTGAKLREALGSLEKTVTDSAHAVNGADAVLVV